MASDRKLKRLNAKLLPRLLIALIDDDDVSAAM